MMKKIKLLTLILMSVCLSSLVLAQSSGFGTLNGVDQDRGVVAINETLYGLRADGVAITYQDKPVRSIHLQVGLRVRYEADKDGYLTKLVLMGPEEILDQINNH